MAAGESVADDAALGDFDARLFVSAGPEAVGDTIALGGIADIDIGKTEGCHIRLDSDRVSRAHAKLVRLDFGPSRWKLIDTNSRNGIRVNGQRVSEVELNDGDEIRIGDFHLRYVVGQPTPAPAATSAATRPPLPPATPPPLPRRTPALAPLTVICPGCGTGYVASALICTNCGTNLKTGKMLITSKAVDENEVAIRADTWIRFISTFVFLGVAPISSEAFGTHKPRATWIITALTTLVSIVFLIAVIENHGELPPSWRNAVLWVGSPRATTDNVDAILRELQQHPAADPVDQRRQLQKYQAALMLARAQREGQTGQFHWYQLLTNTLLHAGLLHLAGNLCFLLVFGLRVNELIGDGKMAVVYPLLAVLSSGAFVLAEMNQPVHFALGASGAIMGLAGMYLVFFPIQRVHMLAWIGAGPFSGFYVAYKLWRMPGFWLLVLWLGLNDVLPTALGSTDNVAHWAHLGGFVSGVVIAVVLMVTRLVDAHGADLLTLTIGRRVWALIGTPAVRASLQPAPA